MDLILDTIKFAFGHQFSSRCNRFTVPGQPRARLGESENVDAGGDLFDEEQEYLVRHIQDVTRRGGRGS